MTELQIRSAQLRSLKNMLDMTVFVARVYLYANDLYPHITVNLENTINRIGYDSFGFFVEHIAENGDGRRTNFTDFFSALAEFSKSLAADGIS